MKLYSPVWLALFAAGLMLAAGFGASTLDAQPPGTGSDHLSLVDSGLVWSGSDVRISDPSLTFPGPEKRFFEPTIAIDPLDADSIVSIVIDHSTQNYHYAIWSADRAYRSTDGGATWLDQGPMRPQDWDGGDPVLLFAPDGTAYYSELATQRLNTTERIGGILVYRSFDGAATWEEPVIAVSRERVGDKCPSPDKEWLSRDAKGVLYLTWTDFVFDCEVLVDDPVGIFGLMSYDHASIKLVRSYDDGLTWSEPELVHDGYALGAVPSIEPDGTLHVTYWGTSTVPLVGSCPSIVGSAAAATFGDPRFFTSTFVSTTRDRGATWTHHETPACSNDVSFLVKAGEFTAPNPTIASDPVTGETHVVFPRWDLTQDRMTMVHTSTSDHGATWSEPTEVTPDPGEDTWLATLHLGDDGVLRLAYVITRAADHTGDAAYTESLDGGLTWSPRTILTSETWDLAADQELGHYIEMDVSGGRIVVAWTDGRNGDWSGTEIWARTGTVS